MIDFSDIVDNRLEGETPLACAKLVELRMLRIFDRICKVHNLTYCLAYGTLLGAVRHGGFIPWDDDIDVHMPLEDYKKFCKIAKDVLPPELLFSDGTEKWAERCYGKIFDCKSYYLDGTVGFRDLKEPSGIFIDVFPVCRYCSRTMYLWLSRIRLHGKRVGRSIGYVSFQNLIRRWFWRFVDFCLICPLEFFLLSSHGKWIARKGCESSCVFRADSMFPATTIRFEGIDFPAPKDPDGYLTRGYGEYMKLPPAEKRFAHACLIVPDIQSRK